jgi:glycosyltransferase involved in cell wall biosynthesis
VTDTAIAVDILHASSTPLPAPAKGRSPQRFLTIYDLAYVSFPDLYGRAYERCTTAAIRSLQPGDRVITPSRFVRDELCERGIICHERVHVVPLAAHPALFHRCTDPERIASVCRRYGIPEGPYVLSVNSPDLRKNVPQAIHAFARAIQSAPDVARSLVLTGSCGPGSDRIRDAIAQYPALSGRIILPGYVADEDLAPLYTGAAVFVYPSLYEGFGLPPLEAMQCGTPVITSNTSSLPEVVGDGGVMVAPDDIDELAAAIVDIADDSARRDHLRQRALARARSFSWDFSTAAMLRAYRAALDG